MFCFNWSSSKLQSNSGFWETYEINSVSHSAWPCFTQNTLKHKYLLLCETTYTFLCGFVALLCFLCCSCEQLAADPVCLCSGYLLYEPPGPCAADRTSWPAVARTHLAAPACLCQGASTSSSAWWLFMKRWGASLLLCFPHGTAYANVM